MARTGPPHTDRTARMTKSPCGPSNGRIRVAHFVWARGSTHGPPHTKWAPRQPGPDPGTFARTIAARSRSVVLCGRREPGHLWWPGSPLVGPFLPCQAGRLSVTGGAQVPSVGPRFRNGGSRPSQPWFLLSSGRRKRPWSGRPGCQRCSERPAMGAPVTPETCRYGRPARGSYVPCLKMRGAPQSLG